MTANVQQYQYNVPHFLRVDFAVSDDGGTAGTYAKTLGRIPAGSFISAALSGVYVYQAYNAGTNNLMDIGTSGNDDLYATNLALGTVATVMLDEAATATDVNNFHVTVDTTLVATVDLSSTTATTGKCSVIVVYFPPVAT